MRTHIAVAALSVVLGGLAGCGSGAGPVFDEEGGEPVSCMIHQAEPPGPRYTDPQSEEYNTGDLFAVLRYYTANGTKPFCDGAPPSETDRAWAQLYVDQTGVADRVSTILG